MSSTSWIGVVVAAVVCSLAPACGNSEPSERPAGETGGETAAGGRSTGGSGEGSAPDATADGGADGSAGGAPPGGSANRIDGGADADSGADERPRIIEMPYATATLPVGVKAKVRSGEWPDSLSIQTVALSTFVEIVFEPDTSGEAITIVFSMWPEYALPRALSNMRVLRLEGRTVEVVEHTRNGDEITVLAPASGFYVLTYAVDIPENCGSPRFLEGDVSAQNDSELARLEGVTKLDGNLTIGGAVTDLAAIRCLTWVTGTLKAENASALTQAAFPALTKVDDAFWLEHLPELVSIDAPRLDYVAGGLHFADVGKTADAPTSMHFAALVITSGITFDGLHRLESLDGLAPLSNAGSISLIGNAALRRAELGSLTEAVFIYAYSNGALEVVDVGQVASAAEVSISLSPALTTVRAGRLPEGKIQLFRLGEAAAGPLLLDFSALTNVSTLNLNGLARLESLDAFAGLRTAGSVAVVSNPLLRTAALPELTTVESRVTFANDASLESVDLRKLSSTGRRKLVEENESEYFRFTSLPALTSLDAHALVEVSNGVRMTTIGASAATPTALQFGSLTRVDGGFTLDALARLQALDGFSRLEAISGKLVVTGNAQLTSISGLDALTSVGGDFTFSDNTALPTCSIVGLRNEVKPASSSGAVTISGNLSDGCD